MQNRELRSSQKHLISEPNKNQECCSVEIWIKSYLQMLYRLDNYSADKLIALLEI